MIYYIDLFCGAGGVSTGIHRAGGEVIACINHDPLAIESHKANHKDVLHFTEDIRHFNVDILKALVNDIRKNDPLAVVCLWASLECTHFSKAKGGESRDADSRTLAEHLYRYIDATDPDYIDIENVVEFMSWGPLRIACEREVKGLRSDLKFRKTGDGYHWIPENKKKGRDYLRWIDNVKGYNYDYDHRILNSADFGARTSRQRYFGQFKKPHLPFTWPEATHAKDPSKAANLFNNRLKKWLPVKPSLDLKDKGRSIFGRKKDLSENTLKRLYAGLIKHVGDGNEPGFITKWMSGHDKNIGLDESMVTITTMNHLGIVQPEFIMKYFSGRPNGKVKNTQEPLGAITGFGGGAVVQVMDFYSNGKSDTPDKPLGTIMTKDKYCVVNSEFLAKYYGSNGGKSRNTSSTKDPAGTIISRDNQAIVFLSKYFSNGHHSLPVDGPAATITAQDHHSLVFLSKYYGTGVTHDVDKPADTLTTKDRLSIVWLDKQFRSDKNHQSVNRPSGSILTNDKHCKVEAIKSEYFLVNPSFGNTPQSVNKPCFTLIARMDKKAPSLVEAEHTIEGFGIMIYDDDSEITKKIKLFMAAYGIMDIKMRMLKVSELLKIQGFGARYKLKGTQTDQKRFIGNSVPPQLVKHLVAARMELLKEYFEVSQVA